MEVRKIQVVGNRSFATSLPKEWVVRNKLKAQDTICINEAPDNTLIITAGNQPQQEQESVSFKLEGIKNITDFIMYCYEKNVNNIRFFWEEYDYEKVMELKKTLPYLEGYDVVQEGDGHLEVAFLFNEFNITLQKIMRRIIYLSKLMIEAAEQGKQETVDDIEMSVDKLYILSKRIIFASLRNHKVRRENNITYDEEILCYRDICKKLENIVDVINEMPHKKMTKKDWEYLKQIPVMLEQTVFGKREESESIFSDNEHVDNHFHSINSLKKDIDHNMRTVRFTHQHFAD
ncbi:hypothetical protein GF367_00755 [Candidatus Woesearchaeota archaeon]|nr:hypothetical protein [Candidatus Woesearchaeota archaeon]